MKKFYVIGVILLFLILVVAEVFFSARYNLEQKFKQDTTLTSAEKIVSVYGDVNFSSDKVFYMNEKLYANKVGQNDIHIFNADDIEEYKDTLIYLNDNHKTYFIFNNSNLDIKKYIEEYGLDIPYYEIITKEGVDISTYMYGGKYDDSIGEYKSLVLAGNFKPSKIEQELESYVLDL